MERQGKLKSVETASMADRIGAVIDQMKHANMKASEMYMVMTEQAKRQQAELDALKARIEAVVAGRIMVEGKIAAYEDMLKAMAPAPEQAKDAEESAPEQPEQ